METAVGVVLKLITKILLIKLKQNEFMKQKIEGSVNLCASLFHFTITFIKHD